MHAGEKNTSKNQAKPRPFVRQQIADICRKSGDRKRNKRSQETKKRRETETETYYRVCEVPATSSSRHFRG
jgi:hypothetical protein